MVFSNPWFLAAFIGIVGLFHLELLARFLNLARLGRPLPSSIAELYPPEVLERTREYLMDGAKAGVLHSAIDLGILLCFWLMGGFGWLQHLCSSWAGASIPADLMAVAVVVLAQMLISLPFDIHSTFGIEARHGFNRTTPGTFVGDRLKSLFLMAALGLPLAALIIWFFRTQELAAVYAWAAVASFSIIMTWLSPRLLMPLFLKFQPLADGALKTAILDLAARLRFPVAEVSVVDGSRRSTKANAFFAGFGKTRRIALFDTLIEKHTQEEILAVLAHEIGHNKRRHVPKHLAAALVEMALLFALLQLALTSPDFYHAFGVSTAGSVMPIGIGLILFGILYQPVSTLTTLLSNALSRKHEFEADAYAAHAMGSPTALITGLRRLTTDHLAHPNPDPLTVTLHYSHPPLAQRMEALEALS